MKITTQAVAGTVESSDAQVMISPSQSDLKIDLDSSVYDQYGQHIIALVKETLKDLDVEGGEVKIIDKGALDCTIKARLQTAVYRAIGKKSDLPWEVL
ncbi:citrate lyase acyl carrier protein [Secundilactobacillus kimchicus]|uniref:Citrate lyase acyl carrier protein n=1 Tax=Secundilactobacillus kimchicus JCM 15530 TaxID=1302272 RepID=A0A0R1HMU0_9LACO|nr:citrate lyase acyl carrier protein [Secundilactobacillus kimchicus]KRK47720.1 hypothetical protein FC96_GL002205 [Secundilactobacillus kimchicus JCM 15530]